MYQRPEVKIEIVLDDDEERYFPGDEIKGMILLTPNKSHTLQKLELAWIGHIQVQPKENEKSRYNYFVKEWKLCPPIFKSSAKLAKGGPVYCTAFTPISEQDQNENEHPVLLEMTKNKTVGFHFEVQVPEMDLPSSTYNGFLAHRISYFLEVSTGVKETFNRQRIIPVYEKIDVGNAYIMAPQRVERKYSVHKVDNTVCSASMDLTVPCHGYIPGTTIPVSINIQSSEEINRKQGVSISLLRIHQVIVNEKKYSSFVEPISRSVQDLQLTSINGDNSAQKLQMMLNIPKDTVPSISLDKSKLMSVDYYIRLLVYAHEGVYISQDYQESQFLSAEVPFIIGTLKESHRLSNSELTLSNSTSSVENTDEKRLFAGNLFKMSSGKNSVNEEKSARKKNVFSGLWSGKSKLKKEVKQNKEENEQEKIEQKGQEFEDGKKEVKQEEKVVAAESIVRHRPFLDSDSEDDENMIEQLEKPHLKDKLT